MILDYLQQLYTKLFGYADASNSGGGVVCTPRKIVAFGNVLLDRTAQLPEDYSELLERFQITSNSKGELDAETLSKLAAEAFQRVEPVANPGGSALNTVRILKQLGEEALFFGAVGEDKPAEELRNILNKYGVEASLAAVSDAPTGQCICLVQNDNKALYANIGASAKFDIKHLKAAEHNETASFLRPIERKQILYIEGFFIPSREHVCQYIAERYIQERRRLALNLSAVYIVEQKFDQLQQLIRPAYFIFGNQQEYSKLMEMMECETLEQMAERIVAESKNTKIIVITKGDKGVQLITNFVEEFAEPGPLTFEVYNVPRVEQVVDSTGAGDAFVAAFLKAWLEKRQLSECVRMGSDVAAKVVTQIGCNLP